jgi:hypothetical protein
MFNASKDLLGLFAILLLVVVQYGIPAILLWIVFARTGKSGAWGLLALIPGIGLLIGLAVLAFSVWPALRATLDEAAGAARNP